MDFDNFVIIILHFKLLNKGPSIYYVIRNRGGGVFPIYYNITQGGSPQFITILHRGVLQSLLQYYIIGRNMKGLIPFSVLRMFLCSAKDMHLVSNLEKFLEYAILGKCA